MVAAEAVEVSKSLIITMNPKLSSWNALPFINLRGYIFVSALSFEKFD